MNDLKLEKIRAKLKVVLEELDAQDDTALRKTIADAEEAIQTAAKERDDNEAYQRAKLAVSDLSAGLRDVKSYQGAKIQYALYRLRALRGDAE